MKPSAALAAHREALRELTSLYGVSSPRVFGSVLTGTDLEGSDLDLLVEPSSGTTLLTISALQNEAEKLLGIPVSVLTPQALPVQYRARVLEAARPL